MLIYVVPYAVEAPVKKPIEQNGSRMKKVIPSIIISALIFATMEVALKQAGNSIDPFQMTFVRFFIGGLILLPFGLAELRRNETKLNLKDYLYLLLLGTVCVPFSMMLFQFGVMYSNAATAAVIFCVNPIFVAIFAHFMNKNDKLSLIKTLAISLSLPGIILIIRPWDLQPGNTIQGALMSIGAAIIFGLYSVLGTRSVKKIGTFAQTSLSFLMGSLVLLLVLLIMNKPIISGISDNILIILYVSIVVTGGGYLFYFIAIRHSNATTGSVAFLLKPALSPIIAVIALSEKITWNMYIGIALILCASWLIILDKRRVDRANSELETQNNLNT